MTTATPAPTIGIMQRLKDATNELHSRAERSEFQQRLMRGTVTRAQYAAWLGQLYLVHAELERHVRTLCTARPDIAGVVRAELFQEPKLREDLAFLGVAEASIAPGPAAARVNTLIRAAAADCPAALLGFYYVLEGSKNGSKYIAKAVRRSLALTPGAGDRYLDPHGEEQPRLWAAFKQGMDTLAFDETEATAMIEAACRMFEAAEGFGADVLALPDMTTQAQRASCLRF